jgi:hypothetical protein
MNAPNEPYKSIGAVSLLEVVILQALNEGDKPKIDIDRYIKDKLGEVVTHRSDNSSWYALVRLCRNGDVADKGEKRIRIPYGEGSTLQWRTIYGITPKGFRYLMWAETLIARLGVYPGDGIDA